MSSIVETARLSLVPLRPDDAAEMVSVLGDPVLYQFTGGEPPGLAVLEARYRAWAEGSPDSTETWHNWVIRLGTGGPAIGHLQATVLDDGRSALVAWLVGTPWQGHGYATEAAQALADWLDAAGVKAVIAHIHPDNLASGGVAARAGLEPTVDIVDGEIAWRRVAGRRHT